MSDLFSFRPEPTGNAFSVQTFGQAAADQTMGALEVIGSEFRAGYRESLGLGTVLRSAEAARGGAPLSEDEYKRSEWYRPAIPYDRRMTADRAAALAAMHDDREYHAYLLEKTPSFAVGTAAYVAGQALDPINYVPILGPAARAAAAARFGVIGGRAIVASADAALNTALAFGVTAPARQRLGDDVSWQAFLADTAGAALIGAAFGGLSGAVERWRTSPDIATLPHAEAAGRALDEAVGALAMGRDVALSPDTVAAVRAFSGDPIIRDRLMSGTAIARVLDEAGAPRLALPDGLTFEAAAIGDRARLERPDLARALDDAQAAQDALAARVGAQRAALDSRTEADALETIDAASAERVRAIDAELSRTIPAARRERLQAERATIISAFPNLAQRARELAIKPEKQLKAEERRLREARQARNRAARAYEEAASGIIARDAALRRAVEAQAPASLFDFQAVRQAAPERLDATPLPARQPDPAVAAVRAQDTPHAPEPAARFRQVAGFDDPAWQPEQDVAAIEGEGRLSDAMRAELAAYELEAQRIEAEAAAIDAMALCATG
ncbi:hypothetical protein [Zavarzinia sp. CC-PAN008]|uniref:hypothetical protein n=1 Tax=Zavarzinia sp. CC-PAN008 TaxID=3243332 RepID=UPI003F746626